ncbi:uncharacterized protein JN550_009127 [Neoarthrinium moseri]|uniref:uncharacterized protein n=1 Tax=Neoarthrinium moseri TaxID=1658444 RepID=UPI001FDDCB8D|nr:uncharacterized protein JN550_009127 [Neoarthrinium moseri]KAI1864107.1 hypothetical protein JN550_009127 [Neoarthrinium moseri]
MADTSGTAQPPQRPLSPWAERFGAPRDEGYHYWGYRPDGVEHSGFAPTYPRLDSRYYYDIPRNLSYPGVPNLAALDELFYSERTQQLEFHGLKTRQAGALNDFLYPSGARGGHSLNINAQYNTSLWNQELIIVDENSWAQCFKRHRWWTPEGSHNPQWTVDDDTIWGHLRISIEIANRILRVLLSERHPWFNTVMFGSVCHANPPQTGKAPVYTDWVNGSPPPEKGVSQIGLRYQSVNASSPSSHDFFNTFEHLTRNHVFSFDEESDEGVGNWTRWAATGLNKDEKTQELISITIVNVSMIRGLYEGSLTLQEANAAYFHLASTLLHETMHSLWNHKKHPNIFCPEPFIGDEYVCELGRSFERAVFGGKVEPICTLSRMRGGHTGNLYHGTFFGMCVQDWPNDEEADMYRSGKTDLDWSRDDMHEILERVRDRFMARELRYREIRPWYAEEYAKWQSSPWSRTNARNMILAFRHYHAERDITNVHRCLTWFDGDPLLKKSVGAGWIFEFIYYIMMGSITDQPVPAEPEIDYKRWHNPSQAAIQAHSAGSIPTMKNDNPIRRVFIQDGAAARPAIPPVYPTYGLTLAIRNLLNTYEAKYPTSKEWVYAAYRAWKDLVISRRQNKTDWADFTFEVPEYASINMVIKDQDDLVIPDPDTVYRAYNPDTDGTLGLEVFQPSPGPRTSGGFSATRRTATKPLELLNTPTKYFTVSQAADRRWVLEDCDDGSVDIYDILKLLKQPQYQNYSFSDVTTCSKQGYRLLEGDPNPIMSNLCGDMKENGVSKGKLLQWLRTEEVAEHDGKHGLPLYVTYKSQVFDVTDFVADTQEQNDLVRKNPGGELQFSEHDDGSSRAALIKLLRPCRCGIVMPRKGRQVSLNALDVFTPSRLRHHDNPSDGMYTAIHGYVYDLTGYVDYHPGGLNILKDVCGRDGTSLFDKYHSSNLLAEEDYAALRIGRVIEERRANDIRRDEIVINDVVFNTKCFENEDLPLHDIISPYYGTNATQRVTGQDTDSRKTRSKLAAFYVKSKGRIVAKLRKTHILPSISREEMAKHNHFNSDHEAWALVGNDVFDITVIESSED